MEDRVANAPPSQLRSQQATRAEIDFRAERAVLEPLLLPVLAHLFASALAHVGARILLGVVDLLPDVDHADPSQDCNEQQGTKDPEPPARYPTLPCRACLRLGIVRHGSRLFAQMRLSDRLATASECLQVLDQRALVVVRKGDAE